MDVEPNGRLIAALGCAVLMLLLVAMFAIDDDDLPPSAVATQMAKI